MRKAAAGHGRPCEGLDALHLALIPVYSCPYAVPVWHLHAQKGGGSGLAPGVPVLIAAQGESFSTVTAAIRSNTCSQCLVHLVLERPAAPTA